ncbi:hypothetical protein SAMN05444412_104334 [Rhodonellum ikkaensis]|uniref:Uncharacterized protein n=1 Tax=Rhodonellum ikkaensis TaxID=336829 RepID=A0A1H3PLT8_9BACT|nr:hypothetical protein SAMN05444412_104334 [Rhodonellum ikkaensis]
MSLGLRLRYIKVWGNRQIILGYLIYLKKISKVNMALIQKLSSLDLVQNLYLGPKETFF